MTSPNNWQRKLQGFAPMSAKGLVVLNYLAESMARDWPFVCLDGIHRRTIQHLFEADLIAESKGADGSRYKITARGERTRQAYLKPARRNDGLCPTCGIRMRHITRSGRVDGYCIVCGAASKRRAYRLKRPQHNPDRPCSRCSKQPVYVTRSGRVSTYCQKCKNMLNRRRKKQDNKRNVRRARSGEVPVCSRPGCTRPRHVTPSCVYVWCREHYREWVNSYRHAKKAGRVPGRIGRPRKAQVQA